MILIMMLLISEYEESEYPDQHADSGSADYITDKVYPCEYSRYAYDRGDDQHNNTDLNVDIHERHSYDKACSYIPHTVFWRLSAL